MNAPFILVGLDFSEVCGHAFREAQQLALRLGGELGALHVVEGYRAGAARLRPEQEHWLREREIPLSVLETRQGTAWVELVRYAEEKQAELVVAGTHGSSGFQPLALGSTASRLAILSPRPVLLVSASRSFRSGDGAAAVRSHTRPLLRVDQGAGAPPSGTEGAETLDPAGAALEPPALDPAAM